ncbi:DNA-binding transcriptional LysR family regulator [Microvirga flocculans]|uniref:DNA-binding transcriptional LysR family regulator n=1 Tax=Microvirga flocculans TaxID=217168 RepID=A0A7W6N7H9_9HYPH|nr:LysR family transcriptional regulator [Microvirga flocculans]MBB4039661.1 DNA-binding transcriptional LysR family regulator [Microvirga flocculans]
MIDWDDLRHFIALADEGSLSAAARRLRIEHATVARRVAALEAAIGVKLVDRRSGRYTLTPDGEQVAEHARRMEAEAFAMERTVHARQDETFTEISVSAPPVIASHVIAPHLAKFMSSNPRLHLRLMGESRTVSLPRREADLAVRLSRPGEMSLVARKIGTITYRLYGSPEYLASRQEDRFGFIGFDESLEDAPHQVWLKKLAGPRPIVFRTNEMAIQHAAAVAHVGIAALPSFMGKVGNLQDADPEGRSIARDVWLTFHKDLRGNAAVSAVATFLAECLRAEKAEA